MKLFIHSQISTDAPSKIGVDTLYNEWYVVSILGMKSIHISNKANLRDLIAATGLVILLNLDSNRRFFSTCDLEIWWITLKNNRTPLICYFNLRAPFPSKQLQSRNAQIGLKWAIFLSRVTLKFDGWHWKTTGHNFYVASSFVHQFKAIHEFELKLRVQNRSNSGQNRRFIVPCDI